MVEEATATATTTDVDFPCRLKEIVYDGGSDRDQHLGLLCVRRRPLNEAADAFVPVSAVEEKEDEDVRADERLP